MILGCMYSGKTTELISRFNRYKIGGKKCIMVKPQIDNRYHDEYVVSHDDIKIQALVIKKLTDVENELENYDVICIDEVQFIDDVVEISEKLANKGKIVELCGLSGNYKREPFPIISNLIPKAENIIFKKAICKETGKSAAFTKRLVNVDGDILIGGSDYYSATDRNTYFKN